MGLHGCLFVKWEQMVILLYEKNNIRTYFLLLPVNFTPLKAAALVAS